MRSPPTGCSGSSLSKLQVCRRDGLPAIYQPIALLWTFGGAFDDEPRLVKSVEMDDLHRRRPRPDARPP